MLDFDKHDYTLESLKFEFKSFSGAYFIFSSVNHTPEKPKLRVWIPLSRTINEDELELLKKEFINRFPTIDASCFTKSRFWFFTPAKEYYFSTQTEFLDVDNFFELLQLTKSDEEIDDAPEMFMDDEDNKNKSKKKSLTQQNSRSQYTFDLDTELLLSDKKTKVKVKDIKQKTRIFCPVCGLSPERGNPDIDNAFININSIGNYYIYCSSEGKTYWEDQPSFNENNFVFIHDQSGNVCRPTENGFDSFKNDLDWYNFAFHHNIHPKARYYVPRRIVIFDPSMPPRFFEKEETTETYNHTTGKYEKNKIYYYNAFISNKYLDKDRSSEPKIKLNDTIQFLKDKCPYSYKVLNNLFGNDDYIIHFINWVAAILQSRQKQRTGWLITTKAKGAGKDFLFSRMLTPLFGPHHSKMLRGDEMGDRFNSVFLTSWLQGFNEIFIKGNHHENVKRKEWIKALITATTHTVEKKYMDKLIMPCHMNFILFSNSEHAIMIDPDDRRFNVIRNSEAVRLDTLDWYPRTDKAFEELIEKELDDFATLCLTLEYDSRKASQVLNTEAKQQLAKVSTEGMDLFIEALKSGDVDYFVLDEVYPDSFNEITTSNNTAKREWVGKLISTKNAIPKSSMKDICKTLFTQISYVDVKKKLENKGLITTTIRHENAHIGVYRVRPD
jgi:hypothetical protein